MGIMDFDKMELEARPSWLKRVPAPGKGTPTPTPEATGGTFEQQVTQVARRIGADPLDLMAIMKYESGMNPSIVNKIGATGLIQFMPDTAKKLGTSTPELAKMTKEQQLPFVERYFKDIKERNKIDKFDLKSLYSAVLTGDPRGDIDAKDRNETSVRSALPEIQAIRARYTLIPEVAAQPASAEQPFQVSKQPPAPYDVVGEIGAKAAGPKPVTDLVGVGPALTAKPTPARTPAPAAPMAAPTALPPQVTEAVLPGEPASPVPAAKKPITDLQGVPALATPTPAPQMTREGWDAESQGAANAPAEAPPAPGAGPMESNLPPEPGEKPEAPPTPDLPLPDTPTELLPSVGDQVRNKIQGPAYPGEDLNLGETSDVAGFSDWMNKKFADSAPAAPAAAPAAPAKNVNSLADVSKALTAPTVTAPELGASTQQNLPVKKEMDPLAVVNIQGGENSATRKRESYEETPETKGLRDIFAQKLEGYKKPQEPGQSLEDYYKQLRGDADTKIGGLMKDYYAQTDENRKKQMWDTIIQAIGGIAAGTMNLTMKGPGGNALDVAKNYKSAPVFDRKYEDDLAKQRVDVGVKPIESDLEKMLGYRGAEIAAKAKQGDAKSLLDLAELIGKLQPGTKTEETAASKLTKDQKVENIGGILRSKAGAPPAQKFEPKPVNIEEKIAAADKVNSDIRENLNKVSQIKNIGSNTDYFNNLARAGVNVPASAQTQIWADAAGRIFKEKGLPMPKTAEEAKAQMARLSAADIAAAATRMLQDHYQIPNSKEELEAQRLRAKRWPGLRMPEVGSMSIYNPETKKLDTLYPYDFRGGR